MSPLRIRRADAFLRPGTPIPCRLLVGELARLALRLHVPSPLVLPRRRRARRRCRGSADPRGARRRVRAGRAGRGARPRRARRPRRGARRTRMQSWLTASSSPGRRLSRLPARRHARGAGAEVHGLVRERPTCATRMRSARSSSSSGLARLPSRGRSGTSRGRGRPGGLARRHRSRHAEPAPGPAAGADSSGSSTSAVRSSTGRAPRRMRETDPWRRRLFAVSPRRPRPARPPVDAARDRRTAVLRVRAGREPAPVRARRRSGGPSR